jgi:beta-N-acetylhexosaminidase
LGAHAQSARFDLQIDAMTDQERIAQMLFAGFSGQVPDAELRRLAGEWRVGGIVLYAHNIESRQQVQRLNAAIVAAAGPGPVPFIAIDQEGGIVHRLRQGVPVVPSNMALGATRSPDLSRRAGFAVAVGLRDLGFTMNFAPVLDVLSEHRNDAIGTRAFSDDAEITASLGAAFVEGQEAAGVLAVGKHFPGQGAVAGDSHETLPSLDVALGVLRERELVPFRRAFASGMTGVMSSHVALPAVTRRADLPATLSPMLMNDLLRKEMRFEGLLITDALQMDALARNRGATALALDAILAGSDMVLMVGEAAQRAALLRGLVTAYRDGRLPRRRVRQALRRILAAKASLRPAAAAREDADALMMEIARRAVTLVPGPAPLVPIPPALREHIVYIGPDGDLHARLAPARRVLLPARLDDASRGAAHAAAMNASLCVVAATNEQQFELARHLRRMHPTIPFVFVNLGSPFRALADSRSATLLLYAEDRASQIAAAAALAGELIPAGKSPVR